MTQPPDNALQAAEPPRILPRADHAISRKMIDKDALWVLYQLHRAGHAAYLVGGGVRDLLLGCAPKDFDVGTSATPEEVKKLIRRSRIIGRRFRLVHVPFGRHKVVEVSTFRRAAPEAPASGDLLIRDDNLYGTPREDAFRRDFTVNALFYNIADFSVVDYVGGLADLDRRLVRSIGDPVVRYREDPVRMIRAVKFAARLGFAIAPDDLAAIQACREEIRRSPPSRVVEECFRVLERGAARRAVEWFLELGLFPILFPGLAPLMTDPAKRETVLARLAALDRVDWPRMSGGRALAFATLVSLAAEEAIDAARAAPVPGDWALAARQAIDAAGAPWPFPRFDRATALSIVAMQRRLERSPPKGRPPRFVQRPDFPLALLYFKFRLAAAGADPAPAERWSPYARRGPGGAHGGRVPSERG